MVLLDRQRRIKWKCRIIRIDWYETESSGSSGSLGSSRIDWVMDHQDQSMIKRYEWSSGSSGSAGFIRID
jgi:hypothetical protein